MPSMPGINQVEHGELVRPAGLGSRAQHLERLAAVLGGVGGDPPGGGLPGEDRAVGGVVVDDEHAQALELHRGEIRLALLGDDRERDVEPEHAAPAGSPLRADLAAHQLDQLLGDGQPEPGAAVVAGGRGVGLREGLEQLVEALRVQADPGVADLEAHDVALPHAPGRADGHDHLALRGELDRVRQQVGEHLAQPRLVAADHVRDAVLDVARELQSLGVRAVGEQVGDVADHLAQIEVRLLELELAGLDLREVEDVVDHSQQ
jgi:hypothetical protein